MNDRDRQALLDLLADQTEQYTIDPKVARAYLLKSGIYSEDGQLMPEYGGPGWEQWLIDNPDAYTMGPR